eukprot:557713-Amphidinium_carterae.1
MTPLDVKTCNVVESHNRAMLLTEWGISCPALIAGKILQVPLTSALEAKGSDLLDLFLAAHAD